MQAVRPSAQRALLPPPQQRLYRLVPVEVDSATGLARVEPGETLVLADAELASSSCGVGLPAGFAVPNPRSVFGSVAEALVVPAEAVIAPSSGALGLPAALAVPNPPRYPRSAFGPVAEALAVPAEAVPSPGALVMPAALAVLNPRSAFGPVAASVPQLNDGSVVHRAKYNPFMPPLDLLGRNGAAVRPHASQVAEDADAIDPAHRSVCRDARTAPVSLAHRSGCARTAPVSLPAPGLLVRKHLTAEQARAIYRQKPTEKAKRQGPQLPQSTEVAQQYGVDPKTIRDIW